MELIVMTASAPAPKSRILSARRLALLAGVGGLGAALLLGGAGFVPKSANQALATVAYAQNAQRPVGFADIVEKVKPSVISVRVKMNAGGDNLSLNDDNPLRGTPFEDFFRRFGQ